MATEISLRITERNVIKTKYTAYRPIGSVISVISDQRRMEKWIEIICDFASPQKRDGYTKKFSWFSEIVNHWTPQLRDAWLTQVVRSRADYVALQAFWSIYIDAQLPSALGKEPHGFENLTNTWLWSDLDRKDTFIVTNTDEVDVIKTASWEGYNQIYEKGNLLIMPRTQVKWKEDIGLSSELKADIENITKTINPRFDMPIPKTVINSPAPPSAIISK